LLGQTLKHHRNAQRSVGAENHLLAPAAIEKLTCVEVYGARDQCPVCVVRGRGNRGRHCAEELGQFARTQGQLSDDTQAAASTALDPPELILIGSSICDAHHAIGCDDLRF
jgi:hypothetical protein